MNRKQKRTLAAIFETPVRHKTIPWGDVERLLITAGAQVIEGDGSRVRFVKDEMVATFHRPHPDKYARGYQVRDAREFLTKIGITP
ncbi:MAG: type II toxin-antitoxin system HicA family toxin [Alphaproteobacteria bacterium]|nr:type II toxin-antitoxin system HicA family toxin [Alphaproteobacteria bacterium]